MYCNYVLYARNNCLKVSHSPTISCRRFGFRHFSLSPLWLCLLSPFRPVAVLTVNRPNDGGCITSYVLNSGVTDPNLTRFLQDVQYRNAEINIAIFHFQSVSERQIGSSNCGLVAAKILRSPFKRCTIERFHWRKLCLNP